MKVRFNRWYNAVLSVLLGLLGFESCDSEGGGMVEEYGCPSADYIIKGIVTDEAGTPVQGIKTVVKEIPDYYPEYAYSKDSTLTDVAGKYQVNTRLSVGHQWDRLVVQDIDGEANGGEFLSDTIDISKLEAKKIGEGDGNWNDGKYEIQYDVKLKKK